MTILMMFWMFFASALAEEPDLAITVSEKRPNYQVIQIYVDITEVHAPDGSKGTSIPLNLMISSEAQKTSTLNHRLQYLAAHKVWEGEINVYDWRNIQYLPTYTSCDYSDAVRWRSHCDWIYELATTNLSGGYEELKQRRGLSRHQQA